MVELKQEGSATAAHDFESDFENFGVVEEAELVLVEEGANDEVAFGEGVAVAVDDDVASSFHHDAVVGDAFAFAYASEDAFVVAYDLDALLASSFANLDVGAFVVVDVVVELTFVANVEPFVVRIVQVVEGRHLLQQQPLFCSSVAFEWLLPVTLFYSQQPP